MKEEPGGPQAPAGGPADPDTGITAPGDKSPGDSARLLATIIPHLDAAVFRCRIDERWTMEYISEGCERLCGYSAHELIGNRVVAYASLIDARDAADVTVATLDAVAGRSRYSIEYRLTHRDGSTIWVAERGVPVFDNESQIWIYEGIIEDITARREAEVAMHDAQERFRRIYEHALEGMFSMDARGRVLEVNPALARILGYESPAGLLADLKPDSRRVMVEPGQRDELLGRLSAEGAVQNFELQLFRRNSDVIWATVNAYACRDATGDIAQFEGTVVDITERRLYQAQIERQANYDMLTGLANRNLLNQRLEQAIRRVQRAGGNVAVAFIDLDQFKFINDTYGHELGDHLLKDMSKRLCGGVRQTDTVARQGGDEFVLLLVDYTPGDLRTVIERLHQRIAEPWQRGKREFHVSSSIGVALHPQDGDTPDVLLRNADAAMYKAKENGRNGYEFFTAELNRALVERHEIERRLRHAIARQQLLLHYQPRVDMESGRICSAEALLRWRLPERGLISPDRFIKVAEDTGLVLPIGRWVLHTACAQAIEWQRQGLPKIVVSVNVSPRQFREGNIVETIAEALHATGLAPSLLQIELTEGLAMHGAEQHVRMLEQIKALGVQIAIDDFGTGYSSLSYLKRFPVDHLKVDRSFVSGLPEDGDDAVIVQAIIALGHRLKLRVVAEGVETEQQLAYLKQAGCDEMQGYYFGKPMIASDLAAMLAAMQAGTEPRLLLA